MSPDLPEAALIENLQGLEALRDDWLGLWHRSPAATPFQFPDWLIPWWHGFGQGGLMTVALRAAGRLVGVVPLYVLAEGGVRKLLPVGVGVSDYLDPLVETGRDVSVMTAVGRLLAAHVHRFDRCDLAQQRPGSPWLASEPPPGWDLVCRPCAPAPVLPLSGKAISGHRRNRLRYYWRRAERAGRPWIRVAEGRELSLALDELASLHAARWDRRGEAGVLADAQVRAFHGRAAPLLHREGMLRLYRFGLDDRIVAVFHVMVDRSRCHVYLCGFDPAFAELSPGRLVIGRIADDAVREGRRELHFLRGQESYKYDWGAEDRRLTFLRLQPRAGGLSAAPEMEGASVP